LRSELKNLVLVCRLYAVVDGCTQQIVNVVCVQFDAWLSETQAGVDSAN